MSYRTRGIMAAAALAIAALGAGAASADMHYTAAEGATVKAYVLTVDKVNRYNAANAAIKHDRRSNPALAKELSSAKDDDDLTLGKLVARMKASPVTTGYYHKAGLSDADAVLIPCALTNGALSQMSPAMAKQFPASAAQIAFVKAHPDLAKFDQ